MKRTLLLAALFLVLGAGTWYILRVKKAQTGTHVSWDMDFAVKNTNDVGKIFIADRKGKTATLERKEGYWLYNGKFHARASAIQSLLETISELNVLNIPPQAAVGGMINGLAVDGIKVEIYDKEGGKMKSYYIGGVTNDERGTIMIMEGAEMPYIMSIPNFTGQLRIRYFLGDDEWRDRNVFSEKPEDIQSISVEYPQQKSESFRLEKVKTAEYAIKPYYSTTTLAQRPQRKGIPEAYLLQFENLGSEGFETSNPLRDSVTALVPFATVVVKKTNGEEKKVRFWPVDVQTDLRTGKSFVVRYFTDYNNGEAFMLTQEHVFGPIFRGYSFFFEGVEDKRLKN